MARIARFAAGYEFLSNFYGSSVVYNGKPYRSSEHAYQAAKADNISQRDFVAKSPTPAMAKSRGQLVQKRADWEEVKIDVMRNILRAKFGPDNPMLRELLLETGDAELVEGNTWGDTFWGVCKGVGENWLGKLLMEVREEARVREAAE